MRINHLFADRKSNLFYLWTAAVIAILLGIEELISGSYAHIGYVLLEFITDIPLFYFTALVINTIAHRLITWLNQHYRWEDSGLFRSLFEIGFVVALTAIFAISISIFFQVFFSDQVAENRLRFEVLTMIMFFIGITSAFVYQEFLILDQNNLKTAERARELEKQNMIAQYEILKSQVNPHFLFNSLNVLSGLIYKDLDLSDQFIKKFSEVYRYVLELNETELVTLDKELNFLDAYIFLQRIRYGESLMISRQIDTSFANWQLPPVTTQILLENAIKHNKISKREPLRVTIKTSAHSLLVQNNYNPKEHTSYSTGRGQKIVVDRYRLLGGALPGFYVEDDTYYSEIPLIK